MKKRSYRRILILPALVLLWSALIPGVARGQEDSIVIPGKTILNNRTEPGAEGSEFGTAVAVDGSTVGVGARLADGLVNNSGAAYLCTITDSDNFPSQTKPPQKKLPEAGDAEASGYLPKASDYFGYSLAISGNALAIGAYGADNGETDTGTAFVARFSYDETLGEYTINEWERLIPSEPLAPLALRDRFGYSVAISGDRAVVGTYYADAAYVFKYEDTGWVGEKRLTAWDVQAGPTFNFGRSVAIDGETIAVGAINGGDDGLTTGSVYVFKYDGSDWVQEKELHPKDLADSDQFGYAVALEGDTLVVGAPRQDDGGEDSGAAYVFRRNAAGTWEKEAKLIVSDLAQDDRFGSSVALSGNTVVVGAPRDDLKAGSAYLFRYDGSGWPEMTKLTAGDDAAAGDEFGYAVDISGHLVVVGARRDDVKVIDELTNEELLNDEPLTDAGSVYVFTLNQPPVADAGPDMEVEEGSPVTLDGSHSYDPEDGDELSYSWTQPDGQEVDLGTADEAKLTFTAPPCSTENEKLTFQLEVKDTSGAASTDEVEVTVLPSTNSITEINSVLGSEHRLWGIDKDIYTFQGTREKQVIVTLRANPTGRNNGGERATLKLKDNIKGVSFHRVDSGRLPNQISATLPATGEYQVIVAGQPRFFRGRRFLGEYTLTVEGASSGVEKGTGSPVAHNKPGLSAKPHKQHPVWGWISKWFRH